MSDIEELLSAHVRKQQALQDELEELGDMYELLLEENLELRDEIRRRLQVDPSLIERLRKAAGRA